MSGKYLDLRGRKQQQDGEKHIPSNCIIRAPTKYFSGDRIKDMMGAACGTQGEDYKYIQAF
jgi:hypothetical protein